jgi:hypothetical protein
MERSQIAAIAMAFTAPITDSYRNLDRNSAFTNTAPNGLFTGMENIWNSGRAKLGTAWLVLLIGAWMIVSPFVIGFSHHLAGTANNIAVGIALILLTLGSTMNGLLRAAIALLGAWMYASAFILGVPSEAYLLNNLILAVLTIVAVIASETPYPNNRPPTQ